MRKAITLLAVLAVAGDLRAQQQLPGRWSDLYASARCKPAWRLPAPIVAAAAGKPAAASQRLTSIVTYGANNGGLRLVDTTSLTYSGTRTSAFDRMYLYYNTGYGYDPFWQGSTVDFDTSYYRDLIGMPPTDTAYLLRSASGKVTRYYQSGHKMQDYTYDAQDRPAMMITKQYNSQNMAWVNSERNGYSHDAQGRLLADTSYTWNSAQSQWMPFILYLYGYNSAGLPAQQLTYSWSGTAFTAVERVTNSYTAANLRAMSKYDSWNGSAYVSEGTDSFAYGAGNAVVYHMRRTMLNGSPVLLYEEKRQLNAAGLPDSITVLQLNSQINLTYDTYYMRMTWNSFGNPVTHSTRPAGNAIPSNVIRYYYDGAKASQSVAPAPVRKRLSAFPNPAVSQISIRPDFNGSYSCSITDAAGHLVQRSNGTAVSGTLFVLPLDKLSPGQYWLQLLDAAGAAHSTAFIKQ